jgi:hypothetical protein
MALAEIANAPSSLFLLLRRYNFAETLPIARTFSVRDYKGVAGKLLFEQDRVYCALFPNCIPH